MYAGYRRWPPSSAVCWQLNVLGQEITQPARWPLFCHHRANTVEQSAWTAVATGHHSDNSNDRWKHLCSVSWCTVPCVWTLRALTRDLLTYLLTYLFFHLLNIIKTHPCIETKRSVLYQEIDHGFKFYHSQIFFAQVQWNGTELKITIRHLCVTCFLVPEFIEGKTMPLIRWTSVWLISYSEALGNKSCIVKRSKTLIGWNVFFSTAEPDKPGGNKRVARTTAEKAMLVFRVLRVHVDSHWFADVHN